MGSRRRGKANIQTQRAVLCHQPVTQTGTTHREGQACRQNQFGTPCSLIDAPQHRGQERHPRTQRAVFCHQPVTQTGTTHREGQACRQNQFGTPCSLIDAPQGPQRPGKAPSNSKGSVLPSASDPDRHNSQGRPGLPSESVWHPMQSY